MNRGVCVSVIVAFALVLGVSGCSDPRKPSKENFARAIEKYLADAKQDRRSLCVRLPQAPRTDEDRLLFEFRFDPKGTEGVPALMDTLVAHGLLARTDEEIGDQWFREGWKQAVFTVNPEYRETFSWSGWICAGRIALVSVDRWTEPADFFGSRVSEVRATVRHVDLPAWMHSDAIRSDATLRATLEGAAKPLQRTYVMQLTNRGWEADELYLGRRL